MTESTRDLARQTLLRACYAATPRALRINDLAVIMRDQGYTLSPEQLQAELNALEELQQVHAEESPTNAAVVLYRCTEKGRVLLAKLES